MPSEAGGCDALEMLRSNLKYRITQCNYMEREQVFFQMQQLRNYAIIARKF